jgi:molybdate-binding protein
MATVRPLFELEQLARNVLVAGCAPLIAVLAEHVGNRFHDARVAWIPTASHQALDLLGDGLAHVAGVHFSGAGSSGATDNATAAQERLAGADLLLVNLTRWRQGFVLPAGNPLGIRTGTDLLRPGLRVAMRDEGAGARDLLRRAVAAAGATDEALSGPRARGHDEVAWQVRCGGADVGIAIESVALAGGLEFVPLSEERFDLVVSAAVAESPPVARLIDALSSRAFRADVDRLPGYDSSLAGDTITVDAA